MTEAQGAHYDDATKEWVVVVKRKGKTVTLRPKQLVLAMGLSGVPNVPVFKVADTFNCEQYHSSNFTGTSDYKGKKCAVVGSNNSSHDICDGLWEHGADMTTIRKSLTTIIRSEILMELGLGAIYSEAAVAKGITVETADLISASVSHRIKHLDEIPI